MNTAWPGGRRVAAMITVMVETWSPGSWPAYAPMALASPLTGVIDRHSVSWSQYGVNAGAWRLLRVLEDHAVAATFGVNGVVAQDRPDLVQAIHAGGHEIAAHGWTQDVVPALLDRGSEEADLRRCLEQFESLTGRRPTGAMSPRAGSSSVTGELLARHGLIWWGDHSDDDLPRVVPTRAGPIVATMHSDISDVRHAGGPDAFHRHHRDLLAALLAGPGPSVLPVTVHAHVGGRPLAAVMLDRVLTDLRVAADTVWIATHHEVAEHVLAQTDTEVRS